MDQQGNFEKRRPSLPSIPESTQQSGSNPRRLSERPLPRALPTADTFVQNNQPNGNNNSFQRYANNLPANQQNNSNPASRTTSRQQLLPVQPSRSAQSIPSHSSFPTPPPKLTESTRSSFSSIKSSTNNQNYNENTPADLDALFRSLAVQNKLSEMISLYQSNPIDINSRDSNGRSSLSLAVLSKSNDVAQWLISLSQIQINTKDKSGQTALHYCAALGDDFAPLMELLLRAGADPNIINNYGWSPIMIASYEGGISLIERLFNFGAAINISNPQGQDAATIAHDRGFFNISTFLRSKSLPQKKTSLLPKPPSQQQQHYSHSSEELLYKEAARKMSSSTEIMQQPIRTSDEILLNDPRNRTFMTIKKSRNITRRGTVIDSSTMIRSNLSHVRQNGDEGKGKRKCSPWSCYAHFITCWAPNFILKWCKIQDPPVRQAWREKVALCSIVLFVSLALAFVTFLLAKLICKPAVYINSNDPYLQQTTIVFGRVYTFQGLFNNHFGAGTAAMKQRMGQSSNDLFPIGDLSKCAIAPPASATCFASGSFCHTSGDFDRLQSNYVANLAFPWNQIEGNKNIFAFNGKVYDAKNYFNRDGAFFGEPTNSVINSCIGGDCTLAIRASIPALIAMKCFDQLYLLGIVDVTTPGCIVSNIIVVLSFILLVGIIVVKFTSAIAFDWFLSRKLGKISKSKSLKSKVILFVTCYSENEKSIRTTLDSLANTTYSDEKKLIFIVSDGNITGSGNPMSTPDIIKSMLTLSTSCKETEPASYIALGTGAKRHNMAQVYSGYYQYNGRWIPTILVVKCGTPEEQAFPTAGNRGKRDSQLILMNFYQRIIMNDRLCPLDYELITKIRNLTNNLPDSYDFVLMVDADTSVSDDSVSRMIACMERDDKVMGLCGETRISNKRESWVTRIQVFEYYISHHLGKAFESIFGGVTCLPGCFCMYRIQAKTENGVIPILANPDVVEEYSENNVDTLHRKNLLLLGEDRYLSTLMLQAFPKRKMMFVPDALCHTTVPEKFSILLSQRRRWINSTIHNLLELVMVNQLCGIFCCSMQFVVLLELIGTVVLPASVVFLFYLIIDTIVQGAGQNNVMSLLFMAAVIVLQALLVLFTTRKLVYVTWMFYYILAIPIWNFVLPLYAFWHFDDFSWGATRKIQGKDTGHGAGNKDDPNSNNSSIASIPLRYWFEWLALKKEQGISVVDEQQFRPFERQMSQVGQSASQSQLQSRANSFMQSSNEPLLPPI